MMCRAALIAGGLLVMMLPVSASADLPARERPEVRAMVELVHYTFDRYAEVANASVVMSKTAKRGECWRSIRVAVTWPDGHVERYRIRATFLPREDSYLVGIDRLGRSGV